ncbi:hypothetical protein JXA27_09980 [Aerococcaceae bacterium zg-B36]|uniref:hypothetical protein n=1 Tax=Aerococcaceae bacterium zg-252 TaxID=2796928 RepID=UPI001BD849ED|nr:hypothetical protein [Aerococcaceae bacterium zg-B36]
MELILNVLWGAWCLWIAVAFYRLAVRYAEFEEELVNFKDLVAKTLKIYHHDIKVTEETLDQLYSKQLKAVADMSMIAARVYNLEQRRPFPRKPKGRK